MKSPVRIILVGVIIVLIIFLIWLLFSKYKIGQIVQIWQCKKLGGEWGKPYLMHPPTCLLHFSDGGKKCIKGNDCQVKICIISNSLPGERDAEGKYVGTCPGFYTGNPFFYSAVSCGEAQIENGEIIRDRRNEPCPIY